MALGEKNTSPLLDRGNSFKFLIVKRKDHGKRVKCHSNRKGNTNFVLVFLVVWQYLVLPLDISLPS